MTYMPNIAETGVPVRWRLKRNSAQSPTSTKVRYAAHATDYLDNFHELVRRWRLETSASSSVMFMIENSNFQQIVKMGKKAIPLIVRELKAHEDFLFMALSLILPSENVIPTSAKGKPQKMIDAWLRWAERNRIDAK
jgi:hypothetical protein